MTMLRLLLDAHISPVIARQLKVKRLHTDVLALSEWQDGMHLGKPNDEILLLAREQNLTLVTYDRRTITLLLKDWAEADTVHGGVIFVDEKTIAPNDFGSLVRSLEALCQVYGDQTWTDWVFF